MSTVIPIWKFQHLYLYGCIDIIVEPQVIEEFTKCSLRFIKRNRVQAIQIDPKNHIYCIWAGDIDRAVLEDYLSMLHKKFLVRVIELGSHQLMLIANKKREQPFLFVSRKGVSITNVIEQYEPKVKIVYGEHADD